MMWDDNDLRKKIFNWSRSWGSKKMQNWNFKVEDNMKNVGSYWYMNDVQRMHQSDFVEKNYPE